MTKSQKYETPNKNILKQSLPNPILRKEETQLETPKGNGIPLRTMTFQKRNAQTELERDLAASEAQLKSQVRGENIEIEEGFGLGDVELSREQEETLYRSMFEHQKLMDDSKTFFDPEVIRGNTKKYFYN